MDSGSLIMDMKGIGPKTNALFGKLGVEDGGGFAGVLSQGV